jgi:hypothetical protein
MKLEVGKRYVRRDGEITAPLKEYPEANRFFRFRCEKSNFSWDENGSFQHSSEHKLDLVSEYIGPEKEKAMEENRKEIYAHLNIAGAQAANLAGKGHRKFGAHHSLHEGYAVLAEEVDELLDLVKMKAEKREPQKIYEEALDVAAMALRIAVEFGYEK